MSGRWWRHAQLTALALGFFASVNAQPEHSSVSLELHRRLTRQLGPGRTETFLIHAAAGDFLSVEVLQQGVHVSVKLTAPAAGAASPRILSIVNSPGGLYGPQPVSWVASQAGDYQITVAKYPAVSGTGIYEIVLAEQHPPAARDFQQLDAEAVLARAVTADMISSTSSYATALMLYQQAAARWSTLANSAEQSMCLERIGSIYQLTGRATEGIRFVNQALEIRHATGDTRGEAWTLDGAGRLYRDLGQPQAALASFTKALTIAGTIPDALLESAVLLDLGLIYDALAEEQKAREFYARSVDVARSIGSQDEAGSLVAIGAALSHLGERRLALDYYNSALSIERAAGDRYDEATTLNAAAILLFALGEKQKAYDYYNQALVIHRALHNRQGEATVLNNIGFVLSREKQFEKALVLLNEASRIESAIANGRHQVLVLNNIATAYVNSGDRQRALDSFSRALQFERDSGDLAAQGMTLCRLGEIYAARGEREKALEQYTAALTLARAIGYRWGEAGALDDLRALWSATSPAFAVLFGKQAVNVFQSVRRDNRDLDPELLKTLEKQIEPTYRDLASLLINSSRFAEAEEVLNLLKDKEASDYIRRDSIADALRPASLLPAEAAALKRYDEIVDHIVQLGARKADLLAKRKQATLSPAELTESQRIDADLAAANTVLNRYLDDQQKAFAPNSDAAKLAARQVADLQQAESVQSSLQKLGPSAVAIYTLTAADQYVAMLVTPGARKAYSTKISQSDLNQKLFAFRQALEDPASDPLPLARELYKILLPEGLPADLAAIEESGPVSIMWSLDGTLRYIPIAALHDGRHYLVERFRNSLITPESLTSVTDAASLDLHGAGFGVSQSHPGFSALPSVPEELHRIFPALVPGPTRLDADFTKLTFQSDLSASVNPIVHVATHFDAEPGVAANSSLLLGDGTKLSLAEIEAGTRLFDGVDLLTLSACSTAFQIGTADGREVDSLGIIAQRLGAKAVVASLWNVSDEATATLMQTLYRNWKQAPGQGKGEALRQAQSAMAAGVLRPTAQSQSTRSVAVRHPPAGAKDWSHPYYWAPFILIGNWK